MVIPIIFTLILLFISILFGINGINPSDPLEYIIPIYNDKYPYPYLDRIILAPILKIISYTTAGPQVISWLAPIIINTATFFISSYYIYKEKKTIFSIALFTVLIIASPFNIATFSYLYPTGILTFTLVIGTIFLAEKNKFSLMRLGIITPFVLFSKIQGVSYIIQVVYKIYRDSSDFFNFIKIISKYTVITILTLVLLYILISLLFNDLSFINKSIDYYLKYNLAGQYQGYGGLMPPFILYLSEPFIILIVLFSIKYRDKINTSNYEFFIAGLLQIFVLISIYYISKRGGALIPNYISPGIYLLTIYVTLIAPSRIDKINTNIIIIITLFICIYVYLHLSGTSVQYFATNNGYAEYIAICVMIFLASLKIRNDNFIRLMIIIVIIFSYKAHSENISRNEWSKPYEIVLDASSNVGARISVDIRLNEPKETSDRRLIELSKVSSNNYGICLLSEECQERYIITNNEKTLLSNSIQSQDKKEIKCSLEKENISIKEMECVKLVKGKYDKITLINNNNEFNLVNNGKELSNIYISVDENLDKDLKFWNVLDVVSECKPLVYSFEYETDFSQGARVKITDLTGIYFTKKLGFYVEGLAPGCELKINLNKKIIQPVQIYNIGYTNLFLIKNVNIK